MAEFNFSQFKFVTKGKNIHCCTNSTEENGSYSILPSYTAEQRDNLVDVPEGYLE